MPRAKANPDPLVETYTRQKGRRLTYRIVARRDSYAAVYMGDKVVLIYADPMVGGFAGHRFPSNKRQAESMAEAKRQIEEKPDDWDAEH